MPQAVERRLETEQSIYRVAQGMGKSTPVTVGSGIGRDWVEGVGTTALIVIRRWEQRLGRARRLQRQAKSFLVKAG